MSHILLETRLTYIVIINTRLISEKRERFMFRFLLHQVVRCSNGAFGSSIHLNNDGGLVAHKFRVANQHGSKSIPLHSNRMITRI